MKLFSRAALTALAALPLLALQPALADNTTGLQDTMKDMGAQMKVLVPVLVKHQAGDAAALKAASTKLVQDTSEAAGRLPDQLVDASGAPLADKAADIAQYQDLMSQLLTAVQKMDASVQAGDNATAGAVLSNEVFPIQQKGHSIFKDPNS